MLEAFIITLREGLEAFLIIAISLAYLRQTGRSQLASAVHWGVAVALGVSGVGAYLLLNAANQEWLEGPLALIAAVSVTWMILHMWRYGRRMKGDIEGKLQTSSERAGRSAYVGVFLFALLMVTREGMETALLLIQLRTTANLAAAAMVGVAGAAGLAWLYSRYGRRINLALFFQVTAIFLLVFVVQLTIQGFHEMAEQHFLGAASDVIHERTESWGPDSAFGHTLTYLLVVLPVGWLLISSKIGRRSIFHKTADSTAH
ncbi:MAG TPA: FTR1 family protein [Vicinamibacterales bacterium]|jgi:high-affinity iron transporter|nr:FTR1 family protein [Vicinamibacterales bacterium]